jgi:hypothetical protein
MSTTAAFAADTSIDARIAALEAKIKNLETTSIQNAAPPSNAMSVFNPSMNIILNGRYGYFSKDQDGIPGFQIGEEGMRGDRGISVGESELNFGANVDDKIYAALTAAIVSEDGEDIIELEEAYIQSLGLPYGVTLTGGRLFPTFGYLNEKHKHTDDFVDRPLPYRAYLNGGFSDDGVQAAIVLPTDFYSEIGGGVFRGRGFPAASEGNDAGLFTAYARIGGDIGVGHAWRLGGSYLHAKSNHDGREDEEFAFTGKDDIYGIDAKYTYSPNGNNKEQELTLQAEYLFRREKGVYDDGAVAAKFNSNTSGFYTQAVYKFMTQWRVGYRYAFLDAAKTPADFVGTALDSEGHDPQTHSLMAEYDTSEFGRFRLQYNYDLTYDKPDNQIILQYTVSFGAHGAHGF